MRKVCRKHVMSCHRVILGTKLSDKTKKVMSFCLVRVTRVTRVTGLLYLIYYTFFLYTL